MMSIPKENLNSEANLFPEENVYGGVCLACKNANGCTYPRKNSAHIVQCEDFCGYDGELTKKNYGKVLAMSEFKARSTSVVKNSSEVKGLCRYCSNRTLCTLPKKEGGNWYCDEYQDEDF
ncbi:MAG: hypothetical protein LWY06_06575 [Firmicutes bacterium]|nr:hypothetical protein [Bacillota bacterium]